MDIFALEQPNLAVARALVTTIRKKERDMSLDDLPFLLNVGLCDSHLELLQDVQVEIEGLDPSTFQ